MCAKASKKKADKAESPKAEVRKIPIYLWGKRYLVPEGLTILTATEYAGYQLKRGVGCRGGVCGACATVYRYDGQVKIEVGLSCQTVIEPNMYIAQLPFFPAKRTPYDLDDFKEQCFEKIKEAYPEVFKCIGCNTCTKSCPMEINVMKYISCIIKGDIPQAAELCFDCVQCGICTARCPAELSQYNVAQMVRRIYGKHHMPKAKHLRNRVKQIEDGEFDDVLKDLGEKPMDELKKLYWDTGEGGKREKEPQNSKPGWMPKERKYL